MTNNHRDQTRTVSSVLMGVFEGKVCELDICEPTWLYAGRLTDTDTGASVRFVYRTMLLQPGDRMYQTAADYRGGMDLLEQAEAMADPSMGFGTGMLSMWEATPVNA